MVTTPGADVLETLHALMHQIKRAALQAGAGDEAGLAPMEVRALRHFARHPGSTASELAEHAGRDKAQIARLLKVLQERGLLFAEPSPHDQRRLELRLTVSGREIARRQQQLRKRLEAQWLAGFTDAERRQLGSYLDRLLEAVSHDRSRPQAVPAPRRAKAE